MDGKRLLFSAIVTLAFIKNAASVSRIDPLVDSSIGLIRGLRASDGNYSMFLGIPYAIVDGANPFGQSIPHPGFDGTFEAYDDSALCPQVVNQRNPVGNLDCLHLNIYIPNSATSANRLPVMVWIHGGGFEGGSAGRDKYEPSYLVRHEVILVTINYRLGPYGFMCLDTPEVSGNQGLKDQNLALKWIKGNIEAFGGDANKITLFGESAGAMSIDFHIYYLKDNLFSKAIMQSGSALLPGLILEPDTSVLIKLAEHLGLKTRDAGEALSFLSTVDTKLVIAASNELDLKFSPCVEKKFEGVESFIDDHPINLLPKVKDIPIITGHNSDESLVWISTIIDSSSQKSIILDYLNQHLNLDSDEVGNAEALLRHFYLGDEEINESSLRSIIDFDSDINFNYPMIRSIQKYLQDGARTVYQYVFSYKGGRNISQQMLNITNGGAAHADEIGYLFGSNEELTPEDKAVIDRFTTLWTNFAKYGNPVPETSEMLPVAWPTVTEDTLPYLNIDSELTVKSRSFHGRMAFWDLFYKIYYKSQKGYRDDA